MDEKAECGTGDGINIAAMIVLASVVVTAVALAVATVVVTKWLF